MYEIAPRMAHHLGSRATRTGDMAEALYYCIDDAGLRLPARRDVARWAHVSETTISRRFRESRSSEERLLLLLVDARRWTHPRVAASGWSCWLPESEIHLRDVRVWLSCLAMAAYAPAASAAVREVWDVELDEIAVELERASTSAGVDRAGPECAELVQAVLTGLAARRALDPDLTHDHALSLLTRLLDALAPSAGP